MEEVESFDFIGFYIRKSVHLDRAKANLKAIILFDLPHISVSIPHFYRPQRSWGKVIFSQASVILLTGGGSASVNAGIPPGPGTPRDQAPPGAEHAGRYGQRAGGTHPTGMQSCIS